MKIKKIVKIGLIAGLTGILIAAGSVYYVFNKPHRNVEKEKPAFVLDASEFIQEFNQDENASYEKYGDQVIQVKGEVVDVSRTGNEISLVLDDEFDGISCALDSVAVVKDSKMLESLGVGDIVTVKGKCDGKDMIMGIVLTRCWIIAENL
ncbi:MAG: hypothetical protein JXJ22_14575 [Bacteroidales bacterium]|nr:hypothetical protein [Bacteroidales bacterium]